MATGNPEGKKQPPEEQRLGPVLRRRGQVTASTTDQRLLDAGGPSDWAVSYTHLTLPTILLV